MEVRIQDKIVTTFEWEIRLSKIQIQVTFTVRDTAKKAVWKDVLELTMNKYGKLVE